ncbi:MAG TPA: hypothetical protein VMW69_14305 [Spirochaetia bacterium]|nr:hypothetical protein [Spirochaetia bacterium]
MNKQLGIGIITLTIVVSYWCNPITIGAQSVTAPPTAGASAAADGTGTPSGSGAQGTNSNSGGVVSAGEHPSLPGAQAPASLLGMTLSKATSDFGAPEQVFPVRGTQAWQDDVVFYYPDHSYLFWFRDRVWQVRVDRRFSGSILGLTMGDTRAQVDDILGAPFHEGQQSEIYILPDQGYPVRARLFFTEDKLSDLYVYRGDF